MESLLPGKQGKTAGNMSYLEKKTQKLLRQLNKNCIIYVYSLYRIETPLATGTSLKSTPSTQFAKVASYKHQLSIQSPAKPKVTTNITLEKCFSSNY